MLFKKLFGRGTEQPEPAAPQAIAFSVEWPAADPGRPAELHDARLFLTDVEPIRVPDVLDLKKAGGAHPAPLVVVAPAFAPDSLPAMAAANMFPVRAGDEGVQRLEDILNDLAMLTRGRMLAAALGARLAPPAASEKGPAGLILPGMGWSDVRPDDLGRASAVTVGLETLTVQAAPFRELDAYLGSIVAQFRYALDDVERESIARRFVRFGRSPGPARSAGNDLNIPPGAILVPGGYASAYFISDASRGLAEFAKARVLVADLELTAVEQLAGAVTAVARQGTPLIVAARSVKGAALAFLVVNKLRGMLQSLAIRVPAPAEPAGDTLQKLAAATGSRLIRTPAELAAAGDSALGRAARVIAGRSWAAVVP